MFWTYSESILQAKPRLAERGREGFFDTKVGSSFLIEDRGIKTNQGSVFLFWQKAVKRQDRNQAHFFSFAINTIDILSIHY